MKNKLLHLICFIVIFFTSCNLSKTELLIGKWHDSNVEKIDGISVMDKGTVEFKSDNTFQGIDTISKVYEQDDDFKIGDLNTLQNNFIIVTLSGTWEIKDNFIIYTFKETNTGIEPSTFNRSEKIIDFSKNTIITEDENHKQSTSIREDNSDEDYVMNRIWIWLLRLLWFVISFFVSRWVYKDAESRGMHANGWRIFVFFLLIIALPAYLLSRKPKIETIDDNTGKQGTQQIDVVYLKDGTIRKGVIVESMPNVSIKIKTLDGFFYVHKMDEIEKITKEFPNNQKNEGFKEEATNANFKKCPYCAEIIQKDAIKCKHCGEFLNT